ncbi:EI24 domain-containing protein [Sulfurovum sp. ST-21]|uniref:EI24 domain-containing protein n=1 Tax=Sulfurovum indicum TaxID=2779528 RepID=A0A7M1S4E7_9BACT|nr:EI24 domain-containing protein [Sulfurovum indicum]QOR62196.1 EI24 domain-containing protein [Sulfurovum indicum]
MNQTITKSFKDLFSATVLAFMAKTTLISLVVTTIAIWLVNDILTGFIKGYLSWIPWEWLQTSGAAVATVAIAYTIFILIHAVVTSLMIEPLLIKLAKKEYPDIPVAGTADISTSILLSLKAGMVFLLLFLFTFPIMFIPLIGAVWMLWLWSILIKEPTLYDVSSLFIKEKTKIKEKKKGTTVLAMIASGLNYIPVLNIFSPVFAQILFLHHVLDKR